MIKFVFEEHLGQIIEGLPVISTPKNWMDERKHD
jgi:hypothetical protein